MHLCLHLPTGSLAPTQEEVDNPVQWRQEMDNELEHTCASYLVAIAADQHDCVMQPLESSSLRARRAEQAAFGARIPLLLDMNKTTDNERLEEVLLDCFVSVQLSMGSKTPHNKEKGQYLGTKSSGIEDNV